MTTRTPTATVLPHRIMPMLAASWAPFDARGWLFEVKWDGVRALASVSGGHWRMWGREGQDYTSRYPELANLRQLPSGTILDGELVALREGLPDFHALMSRHSRRVRGPFLVEPVRYVVFDLLYFEGRCLMDEPLSERRGLLHEHLPQLPYLLCCDGSVGNGTDFFRRQGARAASTRVSVCKGLKHLATMETRA